MASYLILSYQLISRQNNNDVWQNCDCSGGFYFGDRYQKLCISQSPAITPHKLFFSAIEWRAMPIRVVNAGWQDRFAWFVGVTFLFQNSLAKTKQNSRFPVEAIGLTLVGRATHGINSLRYSLIDSSRCKIMEWSWLKFSECYDTKWFWMWIRQREGFICNCSYCSMFLLNDR